jgi:hypothetical protein
MGERRRRHSESEVGPLVPRAKAEVYSPAVHSPILLSVSLFARQRAFFIQARTLPHTAAASSHLHRLSVDFVHHPTLLLFEEAEVGERLLSHSSLGSWSTPSLSKPAVSDQVGAMLQGSASTCRAYPTTVEFAHQAVLFSFPIAPVAFSLRFRSPRPCPLPLAVHRKYASHASYDDQSETRGGTVILDGVHRYHFCTARPYYDCILPVFCGGWGCGCVWTWLRLGRLHSAAVYAVPLPPWGCIGGLKDGPEKQTKQKETWHGGSSIRVLRLLLFPVGQPDLRRRGPRGAMMRPRA